jgi:Uncharacterized protein conserved in bacteria (DUF2272)
MKAFVKTDGLMLRSAAVVKPATAIRALPLAQAVDVTGNDPREGWKKIDVTIEGGTLSGVVNGKFLRDEQSPLTEALLQECARHWILFRRGLAREFWESGHQYCSKNGHEAPAQPTAACGEVITADQDYFKLVGEMWRQIGINLDGKDRGQPWSAAFISFVIRKAGYTKFRFAQRHSIYIQQAIGARESGDAGADYWGFRLTEHTPKLGDLVCQWREVERTYDFAKTHDSYKAHCDVVVELRDDHTIRTIGGNTSNAFGTKSADTVGMKSFRLDSDGFLRKENRLFAILENKR